ncbi:MAG: hypothetical protein C0506_01995 [Anaerolinea sp.]|nr:hypothetical protein [Anaerolinea sp.]
MHDEASADPDKPVRGMVVWPLEVILATASILVPLESQFLLPHLTAAHYQKEAANRLPLIVNYRI